MKIFIIYWVPKHLKCTCRMFLKYRQGQLWWYNILGDYKGNISHILQLDTITLGSILLTSNLEIMKRVNTEPILEVEIFEWRKFIDYFGINIEVDPSRVVKKNLYIFSY